MGNCKNAIHFNFLKLLLHVHQNNSLVRPISISVLGKFYNTYTKSYFSFFVCLYCLVFYLEILLINHHLMASTYLRKRHFNFGGNLNLGNSYLITTVK